MGVAVRIMIFVLIFNLSGGLLSVALEPYYPTGLPKGISYNSALDKANDFNGSVTAPTSEGSGGWWDKFVDFIQIGMFTKFKAILDSTLWGIVGLFNNIGIMDSSYAVYFNSILTIIYAIGIIDLFTGKKVTQ
jgi:hypothetical protein